MEENEVYEHLKLISWLNQLLVYKGENPVPMPDDYMKNEHIKNVMMYFQNCIKKSNLTIDSGFVK